MTVTEDRGPRLYSEKTTPGGGRTWTSSHFSSSWAVSDPPPLTLRLSEERKRGNSSAANAADDRHVKVGTPACAVPAAETLTVDSCPYDLRTHGDAA
jgi:hypothetical protein